MEENVRHIFTLGYFYNGMDYLVPALLNTARSHKVWNRTTVRMAIETDLKSGMYRDEICVFHMANKHCGCNGDTNVVKNVILFLSFKIIELLDIPNFSRVLWGIRPDIPVDLMISIAKNTGAN